MIVDALRGKYSLPLLLQKLELLRNCYYYQHKIIALPDKYTNLRIRITGIFEENNKRYGYRRIRGLLAKDSITISEKTVRRIMKEDNLIVKVKKHKKYSSYKGEITLAVPNIIERDFYADAPNKKWLTDITEFIILAKKIYLSLIVECFDGLIPTWNIGTTPNSNFVNDMLDDAIKLLNVGEHPIVHTDRGCHYRWSSWAARMEKADLHRLMSKKGYSPDNSACEVFLTTRK